MITTAMLRTHGNQVAFGVAHDVAVADRHRALEVGLDERLVDHLRRTADVEGTHGQLGARLADRLRGDDADSLAHVDRRTACQVAAVAGRTDAGLVSQVSTERILIIWMPAASIASTSFSSIRCRRNDDLAGGGC
jgi:hypothetical protein